MTTATDSKMDRLMRWHKGETPGPWTISFYPTYRCNIRCKLCWKQAFEEPITRDQEVRKERMLEIVDEGADLGVQYWILGGGGELMLRSSAVMPMVEKIRARGMNGLIQTNFTRWTEEQLTTLADIGWERLNISMDGPTREINDAIRDDNDFDRIVKNIELVQRIKKERNTIYPKVFITSVVTNLNYNKLKDFIDFSVKYETSPGGMAIVDLIMYGENDKQFMLTPEQRAQMPDLVREAMAYAEEKNVNCHYNVYLEGVESSGNQRDAMDLFSEPEDTLSPKSMCFEPFMHMVIMPEGLSGPCCTFNDPERAQSAWNTSLADLWTGPYMQSVRRQLLQGQPPEYCKECMVTRIATNEQIQKDFGAFEAAQKPVDWAELLDKAGRSLRTHGVMGSFKRGREWLDIRSKNRKHIAETQKISL